MRLVATWFLVIVTVMAIWVVFSGKREPTESRTLGTIESISPVPTWTNTAVAFQEIRQERTTDSTVITTSMPPTPIPAVKNMNPTPTPQVSFATINHNMNVREGPGTNYPVIGAASVGQDFPVTGKSPRGDWWQVMYNGREGWVFGELVTAVNAERIQVALVIPAPPAAPTSTRVVAAIPTATRRLQLPDRTRCVFETEPAIPSPGPDVDDCNAWGMAYALVTLDRPEVLFGNFDSGSRVKMTYLMYHLLLQVASNCNTSTDEVAAFVNFAGEEIEASSNVSADFFAAPRTYILGGMTTIYGSLFQCQSYVAGYLIGLLGE